MIAKLASQFLKGIVNSSEGISHDSQKPDIQELANAPKDEGEAETIARFLADAFEPERPNEKLIVKRDPSESMTDPSAKAIARGGQALVESSRALIEKRKAELRADFDDRYRGPQGEARSEHVIRWVEMIPLDAIREDPTFYNMRQSTGVEGFSELMDSMKHEGLKTPVTVIVSTNLPGCFHVRAGFRRVKAANALHWRQIPAIILPANTPEPEEYWANIIENSARSNLSTYETACAARMMRGRFHIKPHVFAQKAGLSQSYVENLLRALDRLPDEILKEWENRSPIPTDLYFKWSRLGHEEAIKEMLTYQNRNPRVVGNWKPSPEAKARVKDLRMASTQGLSRMQRLRIAIETARGLDDKTRQLGIQIVDFCTGARSDLPGIYTPETKAKARQARIKNDRIDGLPDLPESNEQSPQAPHTDTAQQPQEAKIPEPPALPNLPSPASAKS